MCQKVLLILVDGMRPDAIEQCTHPFLRQLQQESSYCMNGQTTIPPVTLPCHASLFFSVDPERHGITTNVWMPQVRPVESICDVIARSGKRAAMFYNWEELRDLNRPGSLIHSEYHSISLTGGPASDRLLTNHAISCLKEENPDFIFLYLGYTDIAGHSSGWMSEPYLDAVSNASFCIESIRKQLPDDWCMIVTADHGGHERSHGCDIPEDTTIPVYFTGTPFRKNHKLDTIDIKDLAPTIGNLMNLKLPTDWEGKSYI